MWLLYAVLFILQVNMVRPQLTFLADVYERTINSTTKGEVLTVGTFGSGDRDVTYSTGSWNPESGSSIFSIDPQTGVIQVISQSDIPPGVYVTDVIADNGEVQRFVLTNITVIPVVIPPVFNPDNYEKIIRSDTKGEVFTVSATGPDGRVVTYSLGDQDPPSIWSTLFSVDSQTGVIQVISQSDIPPGVYVADIIADTGESNRSVLTNITVLPDCGVYPSVGNASFTKDDQCSDVKLTCNEGFTMHLIIRCEDGEWKYEPNCKQDCYYEYTRNTSYNIPAVTVDDSNLTECNSICDSDEKCGYSLFSTDLICSLYLTPIIFVEFEIELPECLALCTKMRECLTISYADDSCYLFDTTLDMVKEVFFGLETDQGVIAEKICQ